MIKSIRFITLLAVASGLGVAVSNAFAATCPDPSSIVVQEGRYVVVNDNSGLDWQASAEGENAPPVTGFDFAILYETPGVTSKAAPKNGVAIENGKIMCAYKTANDLSIYPQVTLVSKTGYYGVNLAPTAWYELKNHSTGEVGYKCKHSNVNGCAFNAGSSH